MLADFYVRFNDFFIMFQKMGPFLILCSEDDELAPYHVVCNFAQRLQELGGDVKLVKWAKSPHVGASLAAYFYSHLLN